MRPGVVHAHGAVPHAAQHEVRVGAAVRADVDGLLPPVEGLDRAGPVEVPELEVLPGGHELGAVLAVGNAVEVGVGGAAAEIEKKTKLSHFHLLNAPIICWLGEGWSFR